ncbi:calcium-transporting P-type ATPase, PMR1-type [Baia soyae]|uniref:P-type Ca(2+) transporter n=1 Tax=Baia soyae TaxID=1544746 RepID=A0A4R2S1R7_9BACL|nr:calcium-transporting P-type ATPase, PMR1-type [Baia soyae]TCP70368.1 Ca2+-transporting ATPase [Baia soyae]
MSDTNQWIDLDPERVAQELRVDSEKGLTLNEAKKRFKQIGPNQISESEKASLLSVFVDQFKDFMVLVLLAATLISGLLGEYTDAIAIIAIVALNAVLGFIQEIKAEKSLAALKKLSSPTARVMREGKWVRIPAEELVPGDLIFLESGDRIPADVRFCKAISLRVEESALTGESLPVEKISSRLPRADVPLGDRKNMGYMGTLVIQGTGMGLVVGTGMQTEMGKIAHLIQATESTETPLQRRLEQLGKVLIVASIFLTAVVVGTGIWHGQEMYKMFLAGVSLAVAAIPEGLPAIVTVALALGVQRMIKRRAIVRKLPSVETLGCATVICSDKTGTLTQNKMTVTRLWTLGKEVEVDPNVSAHKDFFRIQNQVISPQKDLGITRLLEISVLCNNAVLERTGPDQVDTWQIDGDPTEGALLVAGGKAGLYQDVLTNSWKRMREFPFDSKRKRMSVLLTSPSGQCFLYAKGAPDVLLESCTYALVQGKVTHLSDQLRQQIQEQNENLASMALRNLAFAYREVGKGEQQSSQMALEEKLVFVGLAGMIDPPRPEVKDAIEICRNAGIKTIMITGDHQATAEAIAYELGIKSTSGLTISGQQLSEMSDEQLQNRVNEIDVYARVSPEHKLRIVKALQQAGHVVAMTGDGVNDAPAIKAANIGIAMGVAGTDVSKEASSLILADDNFATIVSAIEEGRHIYDNIRKFISYLLASNVGEILVMFFAMLAGLPLPLLPIQILWVNLVTDGLPAMALGVDPAEENTMARVPRNSRESVFARGVGWKIITRGLLIGSCSLLAFWVTFMQYPENLVVSQTVAFATLVMAQLIYVFDCRSEGTIFQRNPFNNKALLLAVASSVLLLLAVIYYSPLQPIFHTVPIGLRDWILVTVTASLPVLCAGLLDSVALTVRKVFKLRMN